MSDKSTPTLGKLIAEGQPRDAIHIAIAPVVALDKLFPGQAIGFVKEGDIESVRATVAPLGIVDPFLKEPVFPGQRFWMFLYPNTIKSLRHDWTHPAFGADGKGAITGASEVWLNRFALVAGISYRELLDGAKDYLENDEYLVQGGHWEGFDCPDEFWDNYETVTATKVPSSKRGTFFSCSC